MRKFTLNLIQDGTEVCNTEYSIDRYQADGERCLLEYINEEKRLCRIEIYFKENIVKILRESEMVFDTRNASNFQLLMEFGIIDLVLKTNKVSIENEDENIIINMDYELFQNTNEPMKNKLKLVIFKEI